SSPAARPTSATQKATTSRSPGPTCPTTPSSSPPAEPPGPEHHRSAESSSREQTQHRGATSAGRSHLPPPRGAAQQAPDILTHCFGQPGSARDHPAPERAEEDYRLQQPVCPKGAAMWSTIFIAVHATTGVVALMSGLVAVRHGRLFEIYLWSLIGMTPVPHPGRGHRLERRRQWRASAVHGLRRAGRVHGGTRISRTPPANDRGGATDRAVHRPSGLHPRRPVRRVRRDR